MDFWKMNGTGNDFIILNDMDRRIPDSDLPRLARTLCRRRMSIGADGLMVVRPAEDGGDFRMVFFNADGSQAEMCGNGARCICRYGYENGLAGAVQRVETLSGTVTGWRVDARNWRVRLNAPSLIDLDRPVEVDGTRWPCAYVELGVPGLPHAVVPYQGLAGADMDALRALGRKIRRHPTFPTGANVNFYELTGRDHVLERTFERGVEDITLACGTGTGSVAAVLALRGEVSGENIHVDVPGGTLTVDVGRAGERVTDLFLTGPTNVVCKGEITDEELTI